MTDSAQGGGGKDPRRPFHLAFIWQNFQDIPHEQLQAMVEHADHHRVSTAAEKLKTAAEGIKKIGEELKSDMAKVDWEGEGGTAFHTWATDMANATLRLGEYSDQSGTWMKHAADTLREAKAMPKVSESDKAVLASFLSHHPGQTGELKPPPLFDPGKGAPQQPQPGPSQGQAYAAQQKLKKDHEEAARLMGKLEQSYNWTGYHITSTGRPNFPPMPMSMLPPPAPRRDSTEYIAAPGDKSGTRLSGSGPEALQPGGQGLQEASYGQAASNGGDRVPHRDGGTGTSVVPGTHAEQSPTPTKVNGGVTMPHLPTHSPVPTPSSTGMPVPPPPVGVPMPPVLGTPPTGVPGHTPTSRAGKSGAGGTRATPGIPGIGTGNGGWVNIPGSGIPRVPAVGMPDTPASSAPRLPSDGIVGGRPTPRASGQTPTQVPRGTVIGTEPGQGQGRSVLGGPGVGAMPGAPVGRAGSGASGARRLASENGGVVGGRASQRPATRQRPFTPGGMGLVQRSEEPRPNRNRKAAQSKRPDYLVENQESWSQGEQRIVPPVID